MVGPVVFFYGLLASFNFSRSLAHCEAPAPQPAGGELVGDVLCGLIAGASLILLSHVGGIARGVPLLPLAIWQ